MADDNMPLAPCLSEFLPDLPISTEPWPSAAVLNAYFALPFTLIDDPQPATVEHELLADLGYEAFIAQTKSIPTRSNYHDWFNALIWSHFPKTKTMLNQWHVDDIKRNGLHPRSQLRDRITLWDECGVVVLHTQDSPTPDLLASHQWEAAFVECRSHWSRSCHALVFGHAMYESLLSPFIGLTAKWLPLCVDQAVLSLPNNELRAVVDIMLVAQLCDAPFTQKLLPLPVLGIPDWYHEQSSDFYANTDYFRPKRS
jgi:hypothetical protein